MRATKTIWKFPLRIEDRQVIEIPIGHKAIHVGLDPRDEPCMWAEVDSRMAKGEFVFFVVGTGNPMPVEAKTHLGSFVMGPFVWHLYSHV